MALRWAERAAKMIIVLLQYDSKTITSTYSLQMKIITKRLGDYQIQNELAKKHYLSSKAMLRVSMGSGYPNCHAACIHLLESSLDLLSLSSRWHHQMPVSHRFDNSYYVMLRVMSCRPIVALMDRSVRRPIVLFVARRGRGGQLL